MSADTAGAGTAVALRPSGHLQIDDGQDFWSPEQIAALSVLGIRGATNGDLAVFFHYCRRTMLDPFTKQIYYIKRRDFVNGQWLDKWTIQVGIDGFRVLRDRVAERTRCEVEFEDTTWFDADNGEHAVWLSADAPAACRVVLLKHSLDSGRSLRYPAVLRTASYIQRDKNGNAVSQWKTQPEHMIEKSMPGAARLHTDRGSLHIRDIVNKRLPVKVRSVDLATGRECWQQVTGWFRNGVTAEWVRIWAPNGSRGNKPIRMTSYHEVWTPLGWREAAELAVGDLVAVASAVPSREQEQVILGGLLGDGSLGGRKRPSSLPHYDEAHTLPQEDYLRWKAAALASLGASVSEGHADAAGKRHATVRLRTPALPSLLCYRAKPQEWLARLDDPGLAVWFMDDGSFLPTGSGTVGAGLYCCGFGTDFADAAVTWFRQRHGIAAKVLRREKNPYLAFGVAETRKLEAILSPWLHREGSRKIWHAGPVAQGHDGYAFVPVLRTERVTAPYREQRYDIEVEGTHTFVTNGLVVSNCCEAFATRRAFPNDFAGVYLEDELAGRVAAEAGQPAARRPVTVAEIMADDEPDTADPTPATQDASAATATRSGKAALAAQFEAAEQGEPEPDPAEHGSVRKDQLEALWAVFSALGLSKDERGYYREFCEKVTGRKMLGGTTGNLSADEADRCAEIASRFGERGDLVAFMATGEVPAGDEVPHDGP